MRRGSSGRPLYGDAFGEGVVETLIYDALIRIAEALERIIDLIEATAEDEPEPPPLPKC